MAAHHFLEKPAIKAKVLCFVADGKSDREVAAAVSTKRTVVSRQAITAFRHRHTDDLATKQEEAIAEVEELWITDKAERIKRLAAMFDKCDEALTEYGVMITEERTFGNGDDAETVTTRRFNGGMVKEMRGLLSDAANELGQLPKSGSRGGSASIELEDPNGNVVRFSLNLGSDSSHDEDD